MNTALNFLNNDFFAALEKLKADSKPRWGKMSAQHMVEHLSGLFLIGYGRFNVKPMYEEDKLQRNYQFMIVGKNRMKRNIKAPVLPDEPLPLRFDSLSAAIEKLKKEFNQFLAYYEANPTAKHLHPAFGELNFEEWCYFYMIHSQYHLDQFGLWEGGALEA